MIFKIGCGCLLIISVGIAILFCVYKKHSFNTVMDNHNFKNLDGAIADLRLGFKLQPDCVKRGFRQNSFGFVGPEFKKEKDKNELRIMCLGGSTTYGAGVEEDRFSYPSILQKFFDISQENTYKIRVINAGVYGYNSVHALKQVQYLVDEFKPDCIVLMEGLNDLGLARSVTLDQISFFQYLSDVLNKDDKSSYGMNRYNEKWQAINYKSNILNIIKIAKENNISVLLLSDPFNIKQDDSDTKEMLSVGLPLLDKTNLEIQRNTGVEYVNLNNTVLNTPEYLSNHPRVWSDGVHLTRYGYYLIARFIYFKLIEILILPLHSDFSGKDINNIDDKFLEITSWFPPDGTGYSTYHGIDTNHVEFHNIIYENKNESWDFLKLKDNTQEGVVKLNVNCPEKAILYFRSFSSEDSVTINDITDNIKTEIFKYKKKYDDNLWIPEQSWFYINFTKSGHRKLEFILKGENAQLWHKGSSFLFGDS